MYDKLGERLSPQSVLHVHRLTKSAFRWAVKKKVLLRSPFEDVEAPNVPKREMRALSPEEARQLLAAVQGTRAHAWFLFALLTGARQGEIAAL
jgi:integrase